MENKDLKPMSLGDVLDSTFKIYRDNFWKLIGAFGLLYFPLTLVVNYINRKAVETNFDSSFKDALSAKDMIIKYQFARQQLMHSFGIEGIALMILSFLVGCIYIPAVYKIVSEAFNDKKVTLLESYKYASNHVYPYVVTSILAKLVDLVMIIVMLVFLVIIYLVISLVLGISPIKLSEGVGIEQAKMAIDIICVIVLVILALLGAAFVYAFDHFVTASFVINGKKYGKAIGEGLKLACNKFWRYVGSFTIMYIIIIMISFVIGILTNLIGVPTDSWIGSTITQTISQIIIGPLLLSLIVVLTYDYKIKKQGLDIQNDYLELINKDKE